MLCESLVLGHLKFILLYDVECYAHVSKRKMKKMLFWTICV